MGNNNPSQIQDLKIQIIVLNQMRDAIRQISPRLFQRSTGEDPKTTFNRRDAVYELILEALEELEDQLEDLLAKEEEG